MVDLRSLGVLSLPRHKLQRGNAQHQQWALTVMIQALSTTVSVAGDHAWHAQIVTITKRNPLDEP